MALQSGARVGIYEVVSLIGSGGMGEVYLARDTQLGRNVALKVLPDMFASDAERLARFRREAQVLAALHHPNIDSLSPRSGEVTAIASGTGIGISQVADSWAAIQKDA